MAKCLNCGKENNDTAKFCRNCGQVLEPPKTEADETEKTCPNCLKKVPKVAKFCRYCGQVLEAPDKAAEKEKICPNCLKKIPKEAKFCRFCGNQFEDYNVAVTAADENININKNYITWHILRGQLAVKIDERDIEGYGNVKGLYVAPGTQAMFFVNGKYVASLESGKYAFKDLTKTDNSTPEKKGNAVIRFLRNVAGHIKNGIQALFGHRNTDEHGEKIFYSIVLVKGTDFPLLFTMNEVTTANVRSEVGLHILCKLNDLNAFYNDHLVDKKFVSLESFANQLIPVVKGVLNLSLSKVSPQDIENNAELSDNVLKSLRERFQAVYPYITVTQIINLTATHEDLEKVRGLKEELYIAEQELEQRQLREDFLNKMQNADYNNELRSARSKVDFQALMDKIDEDGLLNEDKKAQFVLMLSAERALREARTQIETDNAVDDLVKSKMLSQEEVDALKRAIDQRARMAELNDAQVIAMATMQNSEALDREALKWEIEIGNKRFQNQLERQRLQAEYSDTRRNADLEFQNRQMASKMDVLRQAQALREERENAQHQREMEAKKLDHDAELEHHRINATMSFEQIMASNPNISPDAAAALAKKFEAEALAAQNDKTAELVRQHDEDLKNILAQQMNLTRDIVAAQNQANANAVAEKQRELDRVHSDSERHQDRMLSGMETTVTAVSQAKPHVEVVFCPNCGKKNVGTAKVCDGCGSSLQ